MRALPPLAEKEGELGLDGRRKLLPQRIVGGLDRAPFRRDVPGQDRAHDPPKIDAQVFDPRTVGNGEVGGDPYQDLVQREPLGPKCHELAAIESGEIAQLFGSGDVGEDVVRAVDGREVADLARYLRRDPGVPVIVLRGPAIGHGHCGRQRISCNATRCRGFDANRRTALIPPSACAPGDGDCTRVPCRWRGRAERPPAVRG